MKTYITKFFYGSDDRKVEFVAKFNSYKSAFAYLNRLCYLFQAQGFRVIKHDEYLIDVPRYRV